MAGIIITVNKHRIPKSPKIKEWIESAQYLIQFSMMFETLNTLFYSRNDSKSFPKKDSNYVFFFPFGEGVPNPKIKSQIKPIYFIVRMGFHKKSPAHSKELK